MSGDLESYLKDIRYGSAGDELWWRPSPYARYWLSSALEHLIAGSTPHAAYAAERLGFVLIEYTDASWGRFYILRDAPTSDNISPGGTYVWRPDASYPLVVEVPHPKSDAATEDQGVELFLRSGAAMLVLSGTHRRSHLEPTACDGASSNDYRRSDPAHEVVHLFQVAHETIELVLGGPLFLQLHGFGPSGYRILKEQCNHSPPGADPQLLVNISDGVQAQNGGVPGPDGFSRLLAEAVNDEGTIKACLYNEDTWSYGGTLNVQGRHTNLSSHPCGAHAPMNTGRFVHLEQSYNTRVGERALLNELIAEAVGNYFGDGG